MPPPPKLGIEHHEDGDSHTLTLTGELDVATAATLEREVARLCRVGAREIALDLRQLAFLDSTGYSAIIAAKQLCEKYCCAFSMTRASKHVQRLFGVTGMLGRLPFRASTRVPRARR